MSSDRTSFADRVKISRIESVTTENFDILFSDKLWYRNHPKLFIGYDVFFFLLSHT